MIDSLYIAPTDSVGFFLNGPIPGSNQNNGVWIGTGTEKKVTIKGRGAAVFTFLNTSYLTLGGGYEESLRAILQPGVGDNLFTIQHDKYNNQYEWNDCIDFLDNSDHNVVQNITFINEDYIRNSDGIVLGTTSTTATNTPDINYISHNFIKKAGMGIYVGGIGSNPKGNTIEYNAIGSETDSLITWGIQVERGKNTIIKKNEVQNIRRLVNESYVVIIFGINCYWSDGTIIDRNKVHNVYDTGSRSGAAGILLSGDNGKIGINNLICNNMVYNIRNSSSNSQSCVVGIHTWQQNNPKIYFNSVYLNGKGSSPSGSAALYIENPCTNVEAKNNILVNTRNESLYCASSIYNYTTSNLTSDNNALYYEPSQYNCLVKAGGIDYKSLTDWQAKNKDLNSITEMPHFWREDDLHINKSFPTNLESHGIPIIGIDIDFDEEHRDSTSTDIGADEFEGTSIVDESFTTLDTVYAPPDFELGDLTATIDIPNKPNGVGVIVTHGAYPEGPFQSQK